MNKKDLFSKLPSVDEVLLIKEIDNLIKEYPRELIVESIRESIAEKRSDIVNLKEDSILNFDLENILEVVVSNSIEKTRLKYTLSLKKVVNGTGIVIHTNLGRSLLSDEVKDEIINISTRYSNLEYDLDTGKRGSRYFHLTETIKRLTGAEDVLVVNNNAAAVLLVLNTLCEKGDVVVSRGELVEVGGSFRIPSIMKLSGANLVEVGATNKTHFKDYEEAINENTKAIMKVHTSNYKIMGFTESVSISELKNLTKNNNIPLIDDLGSGVFVDLSKYGLSYEPTVTDSIKNGADIVTFSGDKLLGGPQAGIIVGKSKYIEKMKKNQLTRALRVDKLTICALEATFRMYLDEKKAIKNIPTLKMITYTEDEIVKKANDLFSILKDLDKYFDINIVNGESQVGGGSMPLETIKSKLIEIVPKNITTSYLEKRLRLSPSHIIGRIKDDKYLLDVRTIFEDEYDIIYKELKNIFM